jgi:hypothetical protein
MPMPSRLHFFAPVLLCAFACGCTPAGDTSDELQPADVPAATSPVTARPAPAPPANTTVAYHCTDGRTLEASYGEHDATLRWPGGRSVHLPRAESASKGAGDVYVGETVSLQRGPSRIELHDGDAPPVTCNEAG